MDHSYSKNSQSIIQLLITMIKNVGVSAGALILLALISLVFVTFNIYESPLKSQWMSMDTRDSKSDCNGIKYSKLKAEYLEEGGIVFRSCSLKQNAKALDDTKKFTGSLGVPRVSNAYITEDSVLEIATDPDTLYFLAYLNDKGAFPFQTLNFPAGTQQATHSDAAHFDTLPTRGLMTAAWVALQDIHPDSGPLKWYPGSQKLELWDLEELGVRPKHKGSVVVEQEKDNVLYTTELQRTIDRLDLKPTYAKLNRGETFVWAASLLHGGSEIKDKSLKRKSQVTHYWLEGAEKYWVPRLSYPNANMYALKCGQPVCTSSKHSDCTTMMIEWFKQRMLIEVPAELLGKQCW
jgi:hypothetical protein